MSFDNSGNGNPPARPRGWCERPTLREEDLEAILRKVVERAKQGIGGGEAVPRSPGPPPSQRVESPEAPRPARSAV